MSGQGEEEFMTTLNKGFPGESQAGLLTAVVAA